MVTLEVLRTILGMMFPETVMLFATPELVSFIVCDGEVVVREESGSAVSTFSRN